MIITETYNNI